MEKSESIAELAKALCKFQGEMEGIKKDAANPFFKSKYASLANIIEDTRNGLAKNGLSYAQFPSGEYELTTILMHTSGEWMKAAYKMEPVDKKPQSLGSAITYQRRYALTAILGLQVEDDDGNEASKPPKRVETVRRVQHVEDERSVQVDPAEHESNGVAAEKEEIAALVRKLGKNPKGKDGWAKEVKKLADLELVEDNYGEIIGRLTVLVEEHGAAGDSE